MRPPLCLPRCLLLTSLLALAGCGDGERAPDYPIDGLWAWGSTMNCYGGQNTIGISGARASKGAQSRARVRVHLWGDLMLAIADAEIRQKTDAGRPLLLVRYRAHGHLMEDRYQPLDAGRLKPVASLVDGKPTFVPAKLLYRCPADAGN